ncbi:MAG TPA: hypothetical protein VE263_09380 [Candidatus Angelobacter sp.]|nr:hypothetical protein [Candidatus Angelobacter sp.]
MAPEDRDRSFDKALSRHLRSNASSSAAADPRSDAGSGSPSCLDPEMLAAYHERSLLPEEMNAAKEHIVGCARCQSILAQLEITDSIPLAHAASEKETVSAASVQRARSPIAIRGPRWAWLVPAGALAAGLLAWIGIHENQRPSLLSHDNEVKMAKAQEAPPPAPLATHQAPASPSADQIITSSENSRATGGVSNGAVAREMDVLKQQAAGSRARVAPEAKLSAGPVVNNKELRKDALRDSSVVLSKPENQADLDAKTAAVAQLSEQAQVQNQAANIQTQNQISSQKVLGPAPLGQAQPSKKAKSDVGAMYRAAAPPPAPSAPVAEFSPSSGMEMVAIANPRLIAVPGTSLVWRAGRAGLIEFSSDNGNSWSRQISGVLTDLTAGVAPSANICWMVGRVGTILLTTDGGAHWSLLHSPISEDLGGIRAVDALRATIWNLHNTKSFVTTDGGATWKPVPAP